MTNQAILFDLDGTLIDTAPDFIRIIKQLCHHHQYQVPSDDAIRAQVSAGARAMVQLILDHNAHSIGELSDDNPKLIQYRQAFLDLYAQEICVDSCLFDGLDEFLQAIERRHIPWGIVTNKPKYLAISLLDKLNLSHRCAVLICPDDVKYAKPDPEGLLLASQLLNIPPKHCLYIGDHPRDIEAGRRADMSTVIAGFGYIPPDDKALINWGADKIVYSSDELIAYCQDWLDNPSNDNQNSRE